MIDASSLRYYVSALGGLVIAIVIFLIIQSFVARHQFQFTTSGPSVLNTNLVNNFSVPAGSTAQNPTAPRPLGSLPPPLPENPPDISAFNPPVIPPPSMPLPQIAIPFNTIGGPPEVEFTSPAVSAPPGATSASNTPVLTAGDLVLVQRVEPKYPNQAALQGIQGAVTVRFTVETDGSVSGPVVTNAKPRRGIFDDAALRAVLRWKFKPIVKPTSTTVTLVFNLGQGG